MPESSSASSQHTVLDVRSLRFSYGTQVVLNIERFRLNAGSSMAVLGPSGCGKTTFLHLLAGLLVPAQGSIRVMNQVITQMDQAPLDRFRGRHIGMIFQKLFLIPGLTVRENIALAQRLARKPPNSERVDNLLQQLELSALQNNKPNTLSQGQAQRVAIARALAHDPVLVFADEPTSALDDDRAQSAIDLLKQSAHSAGASLLIVTHDQRVRGELDAEFEMEPLS